eukprot:342916-Hanusia_phi.AAC.1
MAVPTPKRQTELIVSEIGRFLGRRYLDGHKATTTTQGEASSSDPYSLPGFHSSDPGEDHCASNAPLYSRG